MNTIRSAAILVFALMSTTVALCQAAPEWSKKTFSEAPDQVFAAALNSISSQHHEIKTKDPAAHEVTFHVGMTAWSWGYNMVLKVAPTADNGSDVSIEIARSGGKAVSWGSGKKEVVKIFNGIENELGKKAGTS
jgi:Cu/Ag efflux protein CusF